MTTSSVAATDATDVRALAAGLLVTTARFMRMVARESTSAVPTALARSLAQLEELGPLRVSDLAAVDRVSQPTATTLVQKLVDRGWVERGSDPADARAVRVSITEAGRDVLRHHREAAADALQPHLEQLDPTQLRTLADGVRALTTVVEQTRAAH